MIPQEIKRYKNPQLHYLGRRNTTINSSHTLGRGDRNWTKSGGRLLSHGRRSCEWVSLGKVHTTRKDAVPGGYLHRT